MRIHPGPLATSPEPTTIPSDVVRVLGKVALEPATAYVHIRSGIDSLLGDTHLVVIGGKLHVVARKTSLDPLEDVHLLALPEIDEEGYRSVLQLKTVLGDRRVEIGATEENAVHALVGALSADELEAQPDPISEPTVEAHPEETDDETDDETNLDAARAALLGVLQARLRARKARLRADRKAHEGALKGAAPGMARRRPNVLVAGVGRATTDDDRDGVPDPQGSIDPALARADARRTIARPPSDGVSPLQRMLILALVAAIVGFALLALLRK